MNMWKMERILDMERAEKAWNMSSLSETAISLYSRDGRPSCLFTTKIHSNNRKEFYYSLATIQ